MRITTMMLVILVLLVSAALVGQSIGLRLAAMLP
jgi:hypothetical protein